MAIQVLYVDDEPDIREIALMSLELDPKLEVRAAASGAAALQMLQGLDWRPDVILLDLMMPGLDGLATLARLRQTPGCAHTPVIFLTARTGAADVARLREHGATGVITKPFDPMRLAETVRALL